MNTVAITMNNFPINTKAPPKPFTKANLVGFAHSILIASLAPEQKFLPERAI